MNQVSNATAQLSAGQKAAATRRANQAAALGQQPIAAKRSGEVKLILVLTEREKEISVTIDCQKSGKSCSTLELPEHEQAFPTANIVATPLEDLSGFWGHDQVRIRAAEMTIKRMEMDLPALRSLDRFVTGTLTDSEDDTLRCVVQALAGHMRVDEIHLHPFNGKASIHKRGAAYVVALRLEESFLARQPRPKPQQK